MRKHDVVGLSIALVDDQRIVWAKGFGYADKAREVPATAETVYRVGSISKLFTATAIMQLAEQGRIDIDQPLRTYLPQFSIKSRFQDAAPITPRTMMTHHSGLPGDYSRGMWMEDPGSFNAVVPDLKDEFVSYPPNYVFAYSNLAVTLLGSVIEQVSGNDFAPHLDRSVLRPIGMPNSTFSVQPEGALMSKGYRDGDETPEPGLRDVPAGGLNSNVLDIARFLKTVFAEGRAPSGRQILKPSTLAEMLRPQNDDIALDQNFHIGLGWMLSGLGDMNIQGAGPIAHHGGATMFFRSQLIALPEHKLGVVVLANTDSAITVVNKLAAVALTLALEAKAGIKQPPTKTETASWTPSAEELGRFEGQYATDFGLANVTRDGDRLYAEVMGVRFELVPRDPGMFGLQYRFLGIFPVRIEMLEKIGLRRASVASHEVVYAEDRGQRLLVAEKIRSPPISQMWRARVGEYEILNGNGDAFAGTLEKIELVYRDGFLLLELSTPDLDQTVPIEPISDTEALYMGLGRGRQETIRMLTIDGEERAASSGYILRKKQL